MSIIYCSDCTREISTEAEAYAEGPLCVNCRKEDTGPNNLSSHPRCTTCGCGTWQTIAIYQDHFVLEFDCTHERQAYEHDGTKIENCRFCAGSGVCRPVWSHEDITCPYCDDKIK